MLGLDTNVHQHYYRCCCCIS